MSYRERLSNLLNDKKHNDIYKLLLEWTDIWHKLKLSLKNTPCAGHFEDIQVDVLIRVHRQLAKGNFRLLSDSQLASYLSTIGVQICHGKKGVKTDYNPKKIQMSSIDHLVEKEDPYVHLERDLANREELELIHGYLKKLGSPCQELLKAKGLGFSNQELMEKYNFPKLQTVKDRLKFCRKKLRGYFKIKTQNQKT